MKKHIALLILTALTFTTIPLARAAILPLKICIVTGDDLGDDPVNVTYKGQTLRLCCKSCARKFNANPAKYAPIIEKELAKRK
jgi:hypothetical protein